MDSILLSVHPNDPLWIAIAFLFGLLFKVVHLPPLIGFLLAGFFLHALGAESDEFLNTIADLGITLLLFSIGLKLRLQALIKPEVWGVASIHMGVITLLFGCLIFALTQQGLPLFVDLDWHTSFLIGFILSFSSTVFVFKVLEQMGAISSKHGQVAIGVLVIQDVAAVIFLAITVGKMPSLWAFSLLLLIPLRQIFYIVLDKSGHGELLILFGIVLALVGADLFELVGMKGDVGALILGMLLASHSKASELSKALMGFKDLFLVGFFLTIGMTALPGWTELGVALILISFLPLKLALFFGLFNAFYLRSSTSWRISLNLGNYSEFGLIIGALSVSSGWLTKEWLAVFAIVLSLSFILSVPMVNLRDTMYQNWRHSLKIIERARRLPEEKDLNLASTKIVIFGVGRMGTAVYDAMKGDSTKPVAGVEVDNNKVKDHQFLGRKVVCGDATNPDFWIRACGLLDGLEWVMLTLPSHAANKTAVRRLQQMGYSGKIAATSKFDDEERELKELGVDLTFNIYTEAGQGFANDLKKLVG